MLFPAMDCWRPGDNAVLRKGTTTTCDIFSIPILANSDDLFDQIGYMSKNNLFTSDKICRRIANVPNGKRSAKNGSTYYARISLIPQFFCAHKSCDVSGLGGPQPHLATSDARSCA
jgi:hypothetical protein